ncbi:MAG: hypothetical protein HYX34_13340 [Actinobacteria bacterium]|nr:hypothetical protein [Actinomycetota bacterium]
MTQALQVGATDCANQQKAADELRRAGSSVVPPVADTQQITARRASKLSDVLQANASAVAALIAAIDQDRRAAEAYPGATMRWRSRLLLLGGTFLMLIGILGCSAGTGTSEARSTTESTAAVSTTSTTSTSVATTTAATSSTSTSVTPPPTATPPTTGRPASCTRDVPPPGEGEVTVGILCRAGVGSGPYPRWANLRAAVTSGSAADRRFATLAHLTLTATADSPVAWRTPIEISVRQQGAALYVDLDPSTRNVVISTNAASAAFFIPLVETAFVDPSIDLVVITLGGSESAAEAWWEGAAGSMRFNRKAWYTDYPS